MDSEQTVVRIYSLNGDIVGAGFLAGPREVITCAHIVLSALGKNEESLETSDTLTIDFPLLAPGKLISGTVATLDIGKDIAILRLESLIHNIKPVQLLEGKDLWGLRFRTIGFPRGYESGVWSAGEFRGKTSNGWLQVQDTLQTGYMIQAGFSGSPVWVEGLDGVAGMVVAVESNASLKAAFIIPSYTLIEKISEISSKQTELTLPEIDKQRRLKVFLCHSSGDKPAVRKIFHQLLSDGADPWLDEESLLPGQDWRMEIPKAVHSSDAVIIFLSEKSVTKSGYVQKEIRYALDIAEEKPDGTIFLIPARLEECDVPERLNRWHWVDLYIDKGYQRLLDSLDLRANSLSLAPMQKTNRGVLPGNAVREDQNKSSRELDTSISPVRITGVILEDVTVPTNDGSHRSALYSIPLKLSRSPSSKWADLFVATWNHPPRFTTMHRPGILRVAGDKIILNGTTMEELEEYHLETLKLVLDVVNRQMMEIEKSEALSAVDQNSERQKHLHEVKKIASRLKFD